MLFVSGDKPQAGSLGKGKGVIKVQKGFRAILEGGSSGCF